MISKRAQLFYSRATYEANKDVIDEILSFLSHEEITLRDNLVDAYEGLGRYSVESKDIIIIVGEICHDGLGDKFLLDLTNSKINVAKILIQIGTDLHVKCGAKYYELAAKGYTPDAYLSADSDMPLTKVIAAYISRIHEGFQTT
jgi:hypothetical protein